MSLEKPINSNETRLPRVYLTKLGAPALLATLAFAVFPVIAQTGADADKGKQIFEKRCTGCHSLDQSKVGPRLRGVYGRPAGSVPGFQYSDGLRSAHFTWNEQLLDRWLTDPDAFIEDNNMSFHIPAAEDRADVIRYLKSLSEAQTSSNSAQK